MSRTETQLKGVGWLWQLHNNHLRRNIARKQTSLANWRTEYSIEGVGCLLVNDKYMDQTR